MSNVEGTVFEKLSPGELRVLPALATGWPDQKVADICLINRTTLRTHVRHIYLKLGVGTRTELAMMWTRFALIEEIAQHNNVPLKTMMRVHAAELLTE